MPLPPLKRPKVTVLQLTGRTGATWDVSPLLCNSNMAKRLNARGANLHAPGIVFTSQAKDILMSEPEICKHFELLGQCTTILFGVTQRTGETLLVTAGFMTSEQTTVHRNLGAVGFASGHLFDAKGYLITRKFDSRHLTMSVQTMLKVPRRICVGGGTE